MVQAVCDTNKSAFTEHLQNFHLHYADLSDSMSIMQVVGKVHPDIVK